MTIPLCPEHGACKIIPAGVSKTTGRPYNAFFACVDRNCKWKPPKKATPTSDQNFEAGLTKDLTEDRRQNSITRSVALNNAVTLFANKEATTQIILATADEFVNWLSK